VVSSENSVEDVQECEEALLWQFLEHFWRD